jgi:hypothetical protein
MMMTDGARANTMPRNDLRQPLTQLAKRITSNFSSCRRYALGVTKRIAIGPMPPSDITPCIISTTHTPQMAHFVDAPKNPCLVSKVVP